MLGEQGFPGLLLCLLIHGIGLVRMEIVRRRYKRAEGEDAWIAPLATALQNFQIIYLVGALFVGIAFQPFAYLLIGAQIGFDSWLTKRERGPTRGPISACRPCRVRNEARRQVFRPGCPAALHYVDDSQPGITRKRHGRYWQYFDAKGKRITDRDEIDRLNAIGLPPAYERRLVLPRSQRPYPGDRL